MYFTSRSGGMIGPLRVEREIAWQTYRRLDQARLGPWVLRSRIGAGGGAGERRRDAARHDGRVGREVGTARQRCAAIAGVVVDAAVRDFVRRVVRRRPAFEIGTRPTGAVPPLRALDLGPHLEAFAELRLDLAVDEPLVDHVAVSLVAEVRRRRRRVHAGVERIAHALLRIGHDILGVAVGLFVPVTVDPVRPHVVDRSRDRDFRLDVVVGAVGDACLAVERVGIGMHGDFVKRAAQRVAP